MVVTWCCSSYEYTTVNDSAAKDGPPAHTKKHEPVMCRVHSVHGFLVSPSRLERTLSDCCAVAFGRAERSLMSTREPLARSAPAWGHVFMEKVRGRGLHSSSHLVPLVCTG